MVRKFAEVFLCMSLLTFSAPNSHAAKASLGLAANVLQSQDGASAIGANSSLWFLLKPGASTVRQISVRSLANVPMTVTTKIGYGMYLNGVAEFDESKNAEAATWISFSEPTFTLGVGSTHIISMKMSIPGTALIGTNLATLFINGSPLKAERQTSKYAVPGAARIAIPMFVGVGTMAQIATSFSIDKTRIYNDQGGRFASLYVTNNGKTPISPSGSIMIQNESGDVKFSNPVLLYSKTLIPGESGLITVKIPTAVPNGKWVFKETLSQGAFSESKEVKVSLTAPSIFTKVNGIRILAFLISIFILIYALRRRRKENNVEETYLGDSIEHFAIDTIIAEMDPQIAVNTVKKRPVKKVAKKATKKIAKKASAKKKVAAKKSAPTMKKAVKKVAKKTPPRR